MGCTVCAFGHFDLEGGRSWVIRTGLLEHGCNVVLCRTEAKGFLRKYRDLWRRWHALAVRVDVLYLVFLGHYLSPLAWFLAKRRNIPFIADAFLSLYDTEVFDRRRVSRFHPRAWILWFVDWLTCRLADVVLLDTEEHVDYFVRTFRIPREKFLVLPIGSRTDIFRPLEKSHEAGVTTTNNTHSLPPQGEGLGMRDGGGGFIVEFHGTFIPLQGIETILAAAKELQAREEDVRFLLIGKGQTYPHAESLVREWGLMNVTLAGHRDMAELPRIIADADVCLGVFGTTSKALRIIPTKAYEILLCGKPLVTAATPASERVLEDGEQALLVPPGDGHALAEALLRLKRDTGLRSRIAENGRKLAETAFSPGAITAPLLHWLRRHGT
ncbi:MAG: glycosyltransferase family 4 protein [Candidatus Peribacteraceae bacterium]|jgi:glycosyltransferase involved in cell wall biosynthesis